MNEVTRCILIVIVVALVFGGAGYLIGLRRVNVDVELIKQLKSDIDELRRTNRKLESLSEERGRLIEFQRNSNKQLKQYNLDLGRINNELRVEQQRRDDIIGQLESNNQQFTDNNGRLRNTLLEIAKRAGIDVDIGDSR